MSTGTRAAALEEQGKVLGFLRGKRHERTGYELYGAAVAAARDPYFYETLGVADTLDGRFDLVGLHVFLVIRALNRLPPPGPDVAQAVFDAMFNDMDINLREMGVGDMSIAKKVKKMWEAFHGRAGAYEQALSGGNSDHETLNRVARKALGKLVGERTRQRPMIVPVIVTV